MVREVTTQHSRCVSVPVDRTQQVCVCNVDPAVRPVDWPLPPGEHEADWDQIESRFSWTLRRRQLLDGLAEGLALLADAGCTRVWVNGSFVTAKDEPGDFYCVWSPTGVDRATLQAAAPELLDLSDHRAAQKACFGGEFLPNVIEAAGGKQFTAFFQSDRDGTAKGIVVIDPTKETWE